MSLSVDPADTSDEEIAGSILQGRFGSLGLPKGAARLRPHPAKGAADACCEPGVVHLRPPSDTRDFWRPGGLGGLRLAHEAVHVAQSARGGPAGDARPAGA